jgi:hypothetical protein
LDKIPLIVHILKTPPRHASHTRFLFFEGDLGKGVFQAVPGPKAERIFHLKIWGWPYTRGGLLLFPMIKVWKKYFGKNSRTDHS